MKKLQDLTHNINQWNMLGLKPLPPLEIVIIYNSTKEI